MRGPLLVILPHNPGDVVMALLALARVKSVFPRVEIDFLAGEECKSLVEGHPLIRRSWILPAKAIRQALADGNPARALSHSQSFLAGLASARYALSLNWFQERFGGIVQAWVKAEEKAGLELYRGQGLRVSSRYLQHLFAIPACRGGNGWHAVDLYLRSARATLAPEERNAWVRTAPSAPCLPPLKAPPLWVGFGEKGFLALHPGSAWVGKRWPEAHWSSLATAATKAGFGIALTGSPEERPLADRVRQGMPPASREKVQIWAGRTTLLESAWIFSQARMAISGDTVAMHLSAAVGTQVTALFGPSNPVETGPYAQPGQSHFTFQTEPHPAPDLAFHSPHAPLQALSAEVVADFVLEGKPPQGLPAVKVWETAWDRAADMQVLRDARGELHPSHAPASRAARLRAYLDGAESRDPAPRVPALPALPAIATRLLACLDGCLASLSKEPARMPERSALSALEALERELGETLRDDIVWEAYRIGINGLALDPLADYLAQRRARLLQGMREHASLS